jgi:transcriptional regulator
VDSKSAETSEYLTSQINALTRHAEVNLRGFDGKDGNHEPWKVSDAPERYIELMKKAIIGIEIEIERFEGKFKMSQEETRGDSDGVIAGFRELGTETGQRVADLVEERREIKEKSKASQVQKSTL